VADPSHVSGARFRVRRVGSGEPVDFSRTNVPNGMRIRIRGIEFSPRGTAAYRITVR
jgi:hypothetical protein